MYDDYTRRQGRQDYGGYSDPYAGTRGQGEVTTRPKVDAGRLWAGGVVTAVIAALVAFVGLLIARGIFDIPVGAPDDASIAGDVSTVGMCSVAAGAAILATAVLHLMLLAMPRPETFFTVIVVLVTAAFALQPFTDDGLETKTQVATLFVYMATGVSIGVSLANVARYAR